MTARTTVRMKDVAAAAGVSVKTVSNVVNGYVHVAPDTRARVQRALDDLGYRPNLSARSLRRGRSGIIALALPRLDEPYFAEVASLVVSAAQQRGCTVLVDETEGDPNRERLVLGGIRPHLIDGVILSPLGLGKADLRRRTDTTPLVLLGERILHGPFDHVAIDNVAAARAATEHLLAGGRRRVAAIGAMRSAHAQTARLRLQGYTQALRAAGLEANPALVAHVPAYHREDGAAAMAALLDGGAAPDAVFCFNDLLAAGALRTLRDRGCAVPRDVAVVGFDDIEEARYMAPALTSVAPDKPAIAAMAVDALLRQRDSDGAAEPRELRAGSAVVVRESSAPSRSA